ncbi:MAG: radical SAM protein [Candidatus Omnitrophica bacterium]|nr:radical SAM protein [Candidatus Omnitrophota bacterium]
MMDTEKKSVITTMREQINEIAKTPEEVKKSEGMLRVAEEQSRRKKINVTVQKKSLKKFVVLWKNRFKYGVHWSKPWYPFRLARNIFLGKLFHFLGIKKFILRGIEFGLTYKCNFRCNHCLCARIEESATRREMEPNDYERIVKEAMKLGCTTFGLEGGEPFVSPVWEEVIEACQPHYNHIIISTNGYLFDDVKAKRCAELGVDTINFSLDSGYAELHDLFRRKKGSYQKVIEGIALCRKYKINPLINTVVHKDNLYTDHFRTLLDFCEREGLLINTLFAKGVGNFRDNNSMLDDDDQAAYRKLVAGYSCVQRHLNYNYGKQFGCPGTKEMINMTPYGDVMNCANMHIYFGNVMEEPLQIIRDRALKKTPFCRYDACFLAENEDFMNVFYSEVDKKRHITIEEFRTALRAYEDAQGKVLYPELRK